MSENRQQEKWNPGMGSDSAPQPKYDPDFGPGMEAKAEVSYRTRASWKRANKRVPARVG